MKKNAICPFFACEITLARDFFFLNQLETLLAETLLLLKLAVNKFLDNLITGRHIILYYKKRRDTSSRPDGACVRAANYM
jgi:hypothetical protein